MEETSLNEASASKGELLPVLTRVERPSRLTAVWDEKRARYGFKLSNLNLLIKVECASEVLNNPGIWNLPGSSPWLLGLVNLRSNLVPVFDVRQVLGLPPSEADEEKLVLVFDQDEKAVGLLIDDFPKPLSGMNFLPVLPQLPEELRAHVSGGHLKDGAIWLEFDHETFFDELVRSGQ